MQLSDFVTTLFDDQRNPNKLTVSLTMAVKALQKGHSATLILMMDAVALGKPNAIDGIDIGAPFEPADTLFAKFCQLGGIVTICGSCMTHNGFTAEEMVPTYQIITADQVVDLLMNAKGSLQIT